MFLNELNHKVLSLHLPEVFHLEAVNFLNKLQSSGPLAQVTLEAHLDKVIQNLVVAFFLDF
jgi:hypothetical protein